jgi:hypothetical protein
MLREATGNPDGGDGVLAFRDESDRAWEVREIREPLLPERGRILLRSEYSAGWLLFISGEERRRLAPYPPGWRFADAARLRCWVMDARPVRERDTSATQDRVRDLRSLGGSSTEPA